MTFQKPLICLSLATALISCKKDDDDGPKGTYVTAIGDGVSLKTDGPFADKLPYFASCGSRDAIIAGACPAHLVPFMGSRGLPITRELIKEHAVAGSAESRDAMDQYIDGLPEELLPFFAKVKVVSGGGLMPRELNRAAEFGVLALDPSYSMTCEKAPLFCESEPKALPESMNLIYAFLRSETNEEKIPDVLAWQNQSMLIHSLCNAVDAYATHDMSELASRLTTHGRTVLNRFSLTADYPYSVNKDLQAYFTEMKKEPAQRTTVDHNLLVAGLQDATASALPSFSGYSGPSSDFAVTCHAFLVRKTMKSALAVIALNPKTGEVYATKKNFLGDAALKSKIEKILPIMYADPTEALSDLAQIPVSEELTPDEVERILRKIKFE